MVDHIGCSLIMVTQYLDTNQALKYNTESIMNSNIATNIIYHTAKFIPSVSNLQHSNETVRQSYDKKTERRTVS